MKWICKKLISLITIIICNSALAISLVKFGDVGEVVIPFIALGETIYNKDAKGSYEFIYSYLLSTGTEQALKIAIHRRRPNHGDHSFPSGHTANGFVSATFLQLRYGYVYSVPMYAAAAAVGYSRIPTKKHWLTDVLAGAAIGTGSSFVFTTKYVKNVEIVPYYHPENDEMGIEATAHLA